MHLLKGKTPENENEDQRFLRLARDALVATAQGINQNNREVVDPTILDLLTRLQYASSPHGNPISKLEGLEANDAGQLNIQGFYQLFPNLSNNVFATGGDATTTDDAKRTSIASSSQEQGRGVTSKYNPAGNELGWNFLIGEPLQLKSDAERQRESKNYSHNSNRPTGRASSITSLLNDTPLPMHPISLATSANQALLQRNDHQQRNHQNHQESQNDNINARFQRSST